MSSNGHQRSTGSNHASVSKCIESVNSLQNQVTEIRSAATHEKETLPAKLRNHKLEIFSEMKTAHHDHKVETSKRIDEAVENAKKEIGGKIGKVDQKVEDLNAKILKRIEELERKFTNSMAEYEASFEEKLTAFNNRLLSFRGELIEKDAVLELKINDLKESFENLLLNFEELSKKLSSESAERDGVKNELDQNCNKLSGTIADLKNYLNEVMSQKNTEIDQLVERSNGNEKSIQKCGNKAHEISQVLKTSSEKEAELSHEIRSIHNALSEMGTELSAKFSKIPGEIDQKIKIQAEIYTTSLNDAQKENSAQFEAMKHSVEDVKEVLIKNISHSLEETRALATKANESIKKLKNQQDDVAAQVKYLDAAVASKHAYAMKGISQVHHLYNQTQEQLQNLNSSLISGGRVTRQGKEILLDRRIPQDQNGDFPLTNGYHDD